MATAAHPTHVTFHNGTTTLHAGTAHVFMDPLPFVGAGPSRGGNRTIPGVAGARKRRHVRGELSVDVECRINGRVDDDGDPIAAPARDVLADWFEVRDFFEAATGRQLSVTFHHNGATSEADVTYKTHGVLEFPAGDVIVVSFLFALPDGLLDRPEESS